MKRIIGKILGISVILVIMLNSIIMAASQNDLNEVNKKIEQKKEQLNNIKTEKSETIKEVEDISTQITDYETQIAELDKKIEELTGKISESEENLKKLEEDYKKKEELLNQRLVVSYEAGDTSYLDVILSSKSIADLISNYFLVTEVASYDSELMEKIDKEKKEIEATKQQLEADKTELDTSKTSKEAVTNQLKVVKSEKNEHVDELSENEEQTQKELQQFEADKAEIKSLIQQASSKYKGNNGNGGSNSTPSTPSASGFLRPVSAGVTCGYLGYSEHYGIDFGAGYGTPVLASKGGEVFESVTLYGDINCYYPDGSPAGKYRSYGEYIIIDHEDGTMTLYAHGKPGSRLVSKGQRVSQGQQIMSVGNTGNIRPRSTSSNPISGTHLHFEIWVNGSHVNPANYV